MLQFVLKSILGNNNQANQDLEDRWLELETSNARGQWDFGSTSIRTPFIQILRKNFPLFSAGKMSFKFNKKAVVTAVSAVEPDKLLVYAQLVKKISSENGCLLDGNIFCVDVGAAALKKQSKKECRWLEEEVENAKITPGTIITVNGKERYVKTEVCYKK